MIVCKEPPLYVQEHIKKYFQIIDGKLKRTDRKGGLGSLDNYGYKVIKVKGYQIKEHRLIWFLVKGFFPQEEIDHINRDRTDNRIENLRISNRQEQANNRKFVVNPDTGVIGIYLDKCTKGLKKRFTFHFRGKSYRFYTLQEAIEAKKQLRGNLA